MSVRVLLAVATIGYFVYLSSLPNIVDDIKHAVVKAHDEVRDYGINKIAFNFTNINSRSLTHHIIEDDIEDAPIHPDQSDPN